MRKLWCLLIQSPHHNSISPQNSVAPDSVVPLPRPEPQQISSVKPTQSAHSSGLLQSEKELIPELPSVLLDDSTVLLPSSEVSALDTSIILVVPSSSPAAAIRSEPALHP